MAAFLNLHGKSKPAKLTSFYWRAPNAAGGLYLRCQDDMPNTFAWEMSIHPVNAMCVFGYLCVRLNWPSSFWPCIKSCLVGGSDKYIPGCQTTLKSTNIFHWWSKDKLKSNVFLWSPTHGHTSVGWPAKNYIHHLFADTRYPLDDLQE